MLMDREHSQLLLIDVQEKLAPHVADAPRLISNAARLVRYAQRLRVPGTVTEHYPAGLGPTVPELKGLAGDMRTLEKITFSGWRTKEIHRRIADLADSERTQLVVAGMESHVCVLQTVLDLLDAELDVFLVADATGSRDREVRRVALDRMAQAGARIVTQEMVAFEWLGRGDTAEFKDLIGVIK